MEILDWKEQWPNFSPDEIRCKGTGELKINIDAMNCLQLLRWEWGAPIIINSGYRSREYNNIIGGAPNSYHLLGRAFDIPIVEDYFIELAQSCGFRGIGRYATFTHIDTGPARTWNA